MVSDPLKKHSAEMTDGPSRAPARAMLKAIGYTDEDLAKPIIGVATTWIETMPCNSLITSMVDRYSLPLMVYWSINRF